MSESLSTAGHGKRTKLDNARENARSVIWNEKFSRDSLYQAGLVKGWELCEERLAEVLAELLNREASIPRTEQGRRQEGSPPDQIPHRHHSQEDDEAALVVEPLHE